MRRSTASLRVGVVFGAVGLLLAGCQDAVTIAAHNRCGEPVEVFEEGLRLTNASPGWARVEPDGAEGVLATATDWEAEEFRVRWAGSDNVGELVRVERSALGEQGRAGFDFVFDVTPELCERL